MLSVPLIKANNTFDISISKVHSITTHGVIQLQNTQTNNDSWIFHRSIFYGLILFHRFFLYILYFYVIFFCSIQNQNTSYTQFSMTLKDFFFINIFLFFIIFSLVVYYLFWFIHHKFIYAFVESSVCFMLGHHKNI